jgi:ParB-like chromosome segregation protein Spo0J
MRLRQEQPFNFEVTMLVEMRPISSIRPYANNPRRNDHAIDAVATSITKFGCRQPIVVDEEGVIIVGHTRYKAALKLGMIEVPVHVAVGLSPGKAQEYRLADNQTVTHSQWDEERLLMELIAFTKRTGWPSRRSIPF